MVGSFPYEQVANVIIAINKKMVEFARIAAEIKLLPCMYLAHTLPAHLLCERVVFIVIVALSFAFYHYGFHHLRFVVLLSLRLHPFLNQFSKYNSKLIKNSIVAVVEFVDYVKALEGSTIRK